MPPTHSNRADVVCSAVGWLAFAVVVVAVVDSRGPRPRARKYEGALRRGEVPVNALMSQHRIAPAPGDVTTDYLLPAQ